MGRLRKTACGMLMASALVMSSAFAGGTADGVFMDYSWIKSHAQLIDTTLSNRIYGIVPTKQDAEDHTGLIIEIPSNPKDEDMMYLGYEQADCNQRQVITLSGKFNFLNGKSTTEWTNQKHAMQQAKWRQATGNAYEDNQLNKRVDFLCGIQDTRPDSKTVFQNSGK